MFTEDAKQANSLTTPVLQIVTSSMRSAQRAQGIDFYKVCRGPVAERGASALPANAWELHVTCFLLHASASGASCWRRPMATPSACVPSANLRCDRFRLGDVPLTWALGRANDFVFVCLVVGGRGWGWCLCVGVLRARCQLLSTLNVHCIEGDKDAVAKPEVVRSKAIIRSGYLYKKSLKQTVAATCTFVA